MCLLNVDLFPIKAHLLPHACVLCKYVCACVGGIKIIFSYMWVNSAHIHTLLSSSCWCDARQTGKRESRNKMVEKQSQEREDEKDYNKKIGERIWKVHSFAVRQNGSGLDTLTGLRVISWLTCVCIVFVYQSLALGYSWHDLYMPRIKAIRISLKIQWFHVVCEASAGVHLFSMHRQLEQLTNSIPLVLAVNKPFFSFADSSIQKHHSLFLMRGHEVVRGMLDRWYSI